MCKTRAVQEIRTYLMFNHVSSKIVLFMR